MATIKQMAAGGISEGNTEKLLLWIYTYKNRPPAVSHFSEGPDRTIAIEMESGLENQ